LTRLSLKSLAHRQGAGEINRRRSDVEEDARFQTDQDGYPRDATCRYSWGIIIAFIKDGKPISDVDHITVAPGIGYF